MNVSMSTKALLYLAEPIILNVIDDIVRSVFIPENLKAVRDKLYNALVEMTGKTAFTVDDELVKAIFNAIDGHSGSAKKIADLILDAIEEWVASSETKWDDKALLPAIKAFREAAAVPDGEQ